MNTPMNNFGIALKNTEGILVDSLVADSDGSFVFENLVNGSYQYQISPTKPFGGVNATDALLVCKHYVYLITLTNLPLEAGDVNNSGNLTSADALLILRRTVGLQDTFPSGDWVFEETMVTINNANVNSSVQVLCIGDVNGSYIPAAKSGTAFSLEMKDCVEIPDNLIMEVPIRVSEPCILGAVTLRLNNCQNIAEIIDVTMPDAGLLWNVLPDQSLQIAWQSLDGMRLNPDDLLIKIKVRLKTNLPSGSPLFQILDGSEFADPDARILEFVKLTIPAVTTERHESSLFPRVIPNPFQEVTNIEYTLPEDGLIVLSLMDQLGRKRMVLKEEWTKKGSYKLTVNDKDLSPGMYTLHFLFTSKGRTFQEAVKVIKSN